MLPTLSSPRGQSLLHAGAGSILAPGSQQTQEESASLALWDGSGHVGHQLGCSLAWPLPQASLTLTSSAGTIPGTLPLGQWTYFWWLRASRCQRASVHGAIKKEDHCMGLTVSGPSRGKPVQPYSWSWSKAQRPGCLRPLGQRLRARGSG